MQLPQFFDATGIDPSQMGGQLPVGKHPVIIVDSEVKPTKDNSGGMLVLELSIIDGPSKGQRGNYRLNLYNASQQAVEIAQRQLSAICHVTGVFKVQDSSQLHNIPFMVDVALQKDKEAAAKGYTEVVRVYDRNGNEPGKAGAGAPAPMQQQGQPQPQANAWGGAPGGGQPQQQQPPQQPQQQGNGNGWGGQQPQQQQPNPAGGGTPAWGGGAPAGNNGQPSQTPAWGQGR